MSDPEAKRIFVEDRLAAGEGFAGRETCEVITSALSLAGFEILGDDSTKADARVVIADSDSLRKEQLDRKSGQEPLFLIDPVLSLNTGTDESAVPGEITGVAYSFSPKAERYGQWVKNSGSALYLSPFINPETYFSAQRDSATFRQNLSQKHHLPAEGRWVFLSVTEQCNEDSLLATFEGLARLPLRDWSLVVSSAHGMCPLVEQLLPRLSGVSRYLLREGAPAERRCFMAACDLFLSADRNGGNVFDVLEGLASNLAVVAGKSPVIEEVVENGRSGRLSLPGNPASLLNNLTFLLRHDNFLQSHKDNCRSQVVARHDILIAAQCLRRLIAPTDA